MRHRTATITFTVLAGLTGAALSTLVPAGPVSAATVPAPVSSVSAKTAPGMPRFGESGPMVVALQTAIMKNGFTLKGGATGNFDARTLRVLKTFQKVVGLKVTGVVDAPTASVLKLATSATTTSPAPTTVPTTAAPATTVAPTTTVAVAYPFT